MKKFTLYPAIDLRQGNVVRLQQGMKDALTEYSANPVDIARQWIQQGATWLHVVNLDGAFGENGTQNAAALEAICDAAKGAAKIQFGGGLRDTDAIKSAFTNGVARVVIGTAALHNPSLLAETIQTYGADRVALAVDAKNGFVQTHGWEQSSQITPAVLAGRFKAFGLSTLIYTDIQRDGMQTGPDFKGTIELARETGLNVIASGGVSSIADIQRVKQNKLAGVIVGKALYQKNFTLEEALSC